MLLHKQNAFILQKLTCKKMENNRNNERCKQIQKYFSNGTIYLPLRKAANKFII